MRYIAILLLLASCIRVHKYPPDLHSDSVVIVDEEKGAGYWYDALGRISDSNFKVFDVRSHDYDNTPPGGNEPAIQAALDSASERVSTGSKIFYPKKDTL